jgi:hypothetical protein
LVVAVVGHADEPVSGGQVGLGLGAEACGAAVELVGEVDGKGVRAAHRGEGGSEVVEVDGDDTPPVVGLDGATAVRQVGGAGGRCPLAPQVATACVSCSAMAGSWLVICRSAVAIAGRSCRRLMVSGLASSPNWLRRVSWSSAAAAVRWVAAVCRVRVPSS